MICSNCEKEVNPAHEFCNNCGAKIDKPSEKLKELIKKAEVGDAQAQAEVGRAYYLGNEGVSEDYNEARKWFEKASLQDNALGCWGLGSMYLDGEGGLPEDLIKALEYVKKSVANNCSEGQTLLGYIYENGNGVEKDLIEACRWYRLAANQGYSRAQCNLGYMYENGNGVEKDLIEACRWYRLAADQGYKWAQNQLGVMYENGDGFQKDYSHAAFWYKKAADQDYSQAQSNLGWAYYNGEGVEQNYSYALYWFNRAAEQEDKFRRGRAFALEKLGRYSEAANDYRIYYKKIPPSYSFSEKSDWSDYINHHYKNILLPKILSRGLDVIYVCPCSLIWNYKDEEHLAGGSSYYRITGDYGVGYAVLTNKSVMCVSSGALSTKYKPFKKIHTWFIGNTYDYRKIIHYNAFEEISYEFIKDFYLDKDGGVNIEAGNNIYLSPYFTNDEKVVISMINLGKQEYFDKPYKQEDDTTGKDNVKKLKQLKELLDSGVLTQEEYEERRNKALSEMGL